MKTDYHTCKVELVGQVATITIVPPMELAGGTADLHWDLGEIFGDAGRHARSAIGMAVLPRNTPVEVEFVAAVQG